MSVRQLVYDGLRNWDPLSDLLAEGFNGIRAGSSLTGREYQKPFVVYRCQNINSALRGDDDVEILHQRVEIWVYDEPGSFNRIEAAIAAIMALMPTIPNLKAIFGGISDELPDDEMKAITKNIVYTCSELG